MIAPSAATPTAIQEQAQYVGSGSEIKDSGETDPDRRVIRKVVGVAAVTSGPTDFGEPYTSQNRDCSQTDTRGISHENRS